MNDVLGPKCCFLLTCTKGVKTLKVYYVECSESQSFEMLVMVESASVSL